jgi:hypothetical protein
VTVSFPADWTPRPVVGDGSSVAIDGPGGSVVRFSHPTAGSWTAASCDQQAPAEVPDFVASGSEPLTIDGLPTTEYVVPDKTLTSYAAATFSGDGQCWTATAQPGNQALDHRVVDMILSSVQYGHF